MKRLPLFSLLLISALLLGGVGYSARAEQINLPELPSWTSNGEQVGGEYGSAVSTAGDVNGDGVADILVGAPLASVSVYREGVVDAFYGSNQNGLAQEANWVEGGGQEASRFGTAVAAAGDVNNDGFDDVLIGSPGYDTAEQQPNHGAAFLYLGSGDGLQADPTWFVQGDKKEFELGNALDGAGDLNGDQYLDLVISVHHYTDEQFLEGQVRVYYGSASGFESTSYWSYASNQSGARLGTAVAGVGDLNGDGFDDLAVSAQYYDTEFDSAGAVFVFYGSELGLGTEFDWLATGSSEDELFGASIASPGDLNLDGFTDLLVGAPAYDSSYIMDQGAAFVYLGSADGLSSHPAYVWNGWQSDSQFGASLSGGGDINADGYPDVIVGAPFYVEDKATVGSIFVFYGREQGFLSRYDWQNFGKAFSEYGSSVAAAGDVNGDGYGDILAGAPEYKIAEDPMGRAVGYYGDFDPVYWQLFVPMVVKQGPGE